MRLLKLLVYSVLGYAIYQFIQGVQAHGESFEGDGGQRRGGRSRVGVGARENITGPGEGQDVEVADSDGGVSHHRVGRGVV